MQFFLQANKKILYCIFLLTSFSISAQSMLDIKEHRPDDERTIARRPRFSEDSKEDFLSPARHLTQLADSKYDGIRPLLLSGIQSYQDATEASLYITRFPESWRYFSEIDQQWHFQYNGKRYFIEYMDELELHNIYEKREEINTFHFNIYAEGKFILSTELQYVNNKLNHEAVITLKENTLKVEVWKSGSKIVDDSFDITGFHYCVSTNFYPKYLVNKDKADLIQYNIDLQRLISYKIVKDGDAIQSLWQKPYNLKAYFYFDENKILDRYEIPDFNTYLERVWSLEKIIEKRTFSNNTTTSLYMITSFPSNCRLRDTDYLKRLKVRVHYNKIPEDFQVEKYFINGRIELIDKKTNTVEITMEYSQNSSPPQPDLFSSDALYMGDNPEISAMAMNIIGDTDDHFTIMLNLMAWVYNNMSYNPREPEKDALETLRQLSGDCTEYAKLLASLARSVNIPCKIVYGYCAGFSSFEAHSWVIARVKGRWIVYDATGNMCDPGLTHIQSPFEYITPGISSIEVITAEYYDGSIITEETKVSN